MMHHLTTLIKLINFLNAKDLLFKARATLGTAAVLILSVIAALAGVPMSVCLVILMLAPVVTIVGYEIHGHQHQSAMLTADAAKGVNIKALES